MGDRSSNLELTLSQHTRRSKGCISFLLCALFQFPHFPFMHVSADSELTAIPNIQWVDVNYPITTDHHQMLLLAGENSARKSTTNGQKEADRS